MDYVEVFDLSELPVGQMKSVEVSGREILLANADGTIFAIANKCSHLGGSLAKGSLEGNTVTCPKHGAQFDLDSGKAVGKARIAIVNLGVKDLESYPVMIEETQVLVGIPK
jgi:3-phenylpropionate/trans-cinnamate dioxygenase ferredoxin subunit